MWHSIFSPNPRRWMYILGATQIEAEQKITSQAVGWVVSRDGSHRQSPINGHSEILRFVECRIFVGRFDRTEMSEGCGRCLNL